MSQYPPPGPPGPPPYGYWPPPPPHYPPQPHTYPSQGPPPYPGYYVPGVMMPLPMPGPPESNPTYITNYIYHGAGAGGGGEPSNDNQVSVSNQVQVAEISGEYDWVPSTAMAAGYMTGKALVGGHEGWDGSPLWVIRGWHNGDLIPGKYSVRHNSATIVYEGKEIPLQNIEVLIAQPESLRWVPASNGSIPPGAIPGGRTASGETLYVGRARHQLSITPGKVHPSHNTCYIAFAGAEVSHKIYDVLCRIS